MKFIKKNRLDIIIVLIILLSAPLFFYKLGQSSLISWDEAWYGSIAKNILSSGDIFNLRFNNAYFSDHPPGGIWPIALAYNIIGISDFSTRLPSALAGILSLVVIFFLGKKLFNRVVGLASSIALCSSFWFILRSRQGNLDALLVLFFLLTTYLAILAIDKRKFYLFFSLSLGYLTTVKSSLPFAVIPTLIIIFFRNKIYKIRDYLLPVLFIILFLGIWFIFLYLISPELVRHYFVHSGRNTSLMFNDYIKSFDTLKLYLHNGIGKWFWPGIAAIFIGPLLRQKRFIILTSFFLGYSVPLLTSPQIEIWHLIPLYPFMILAFWGLTWVVLEKTVPVNRFKQILISTAIMAVCFYFSFLQIRRMWYEFIDIPAYISDEAILSGEAGKFFAPYFIDGDFVPTAVFYSDKPVTQIWGGGIPELFADNITFSLLTKQSRLDQNNISKSSYQIIKQDRDKILILKK